MEKMQWSLKNHKMKIGSWDKLQKFDLREEFFQVPEPDKAHNLGYFPKERVILWGLTWE